MNPELSEDFANALLALGAAALAALVTTVIVAVGVYYLGWVLGDMWIFVVPAPGAIVGVWTFLTIYKKFKRP